MAKPRTAPRLATKLSATDEQLLAQAIAAHNSNQPLYATKVQMHTLLNWVQGPLVEFNEALNNGDPAMIAFRATPQGLAMNQPEQTAQQQQPAQTAGATSDTTTATDFEIEEGIEIPALKRGGRGGNAKRYPFEQMGLNASFFIPKTEENPKPSKRIASVVSNASKSLAPKKFKVQAVNEVGGKGEGARVWRIE